MCQPKKSYLFSIKTITHKYLTQIVLWICLNFKNRKLITSPGIDYSISNLSCRHPVMEFCHVVLSMMRLPKISWRNACSSPTLMDATTNHHAIILNKKMIWPSKPSEIILIIFSNSLKLFYWDVFISIVSRTLTNQNKNWQGFLRKLKISS